MRPMAAEHGGAARTRPRATRQKRAVASLLEATGEFTSAQELHARLRAAGERIGLATVYSQLRSLAAAGEIDSLRADSGETLCRRCGRTVEVDAPELETLAVRLGEDHGFADLRHVVEITGICPECTRSP